MEKDLAMTGVGYEFQSIEDAQALILELAKWLRSVDNRNLLAALLYRIDVKVELGSQTDYVDISQMAWNRVLQKVVTRISYSRSITPRTESDS